MKFTLAYTLLVLYVISAIVFWGYSLNKQAGVVYQLEQRFLNETKKNLGAEEYRKEYKEIYDKRLRRKKQYLGEGGTFLLITIFASSLIYIAYYRQRRLSRLQQNFMLSITHELKTPVAGIKLNMQTMEKHQLEESMRMKLVRSTIAESNRLNDLCNNVLVATQLEGQHKAFYSEDIHLADLLETKAGEFSDRYPDLHIKLHIDYPEFSFKGESTLWNLVISNLIENARKYSPEGSPIDLSLTKEYDEAVFSVADQGVGISEEEKEHIFKKFYRVGREETRRTKGTGLGLYLVKKITELYKYDIRVRNNSPVGSIFEIRMR